MHLTGSKHCPVRHCFGVPITYCSITKCGAFPLPIFPYLFHFCIYGVNVIGAFRESNAAPKTPAMTPVSITWSLSALRLEHAYPLEEHSAGSTVLSQHKVELANAQVREVDAHATADALLQATCTVEDHTMRAEHTATLAEWEVRFLKALNVHSSLDP